DERVVDNWVDDRSIMLLNNNGLTSLEASNTSTNTTSIRGCKRTSTRAYALAWLCKDPSIFTSLERLFKLLKNQLAVSDCSCGCRYSFLSFCDCLFLWIVVGWNKVTSQFWFNPES